MKAGTRDLHGGDPRQRFAAWAQIAAARARGFVPAPFASTIAALLARSPCVGSRGGSTATARRFSSAGSTPSD